MHKIDVTKLSIEAIDLWMNQWLLLTAGSHDDFNMMTVAWGSIGCMWSKPFIQIVVRPQRYTYKYMEKYDNFTLCAFPPEYRKDLKLLGTLSGKDGNKLSKTAFTIKDSENISSPSYHEARLIFECKTMYYQDMEPAGFMDKSIINNYPQNDFHRIYFGEIIASFIRE